MIGAGGTALVSVTLGEGKREKANQTFSLLVYVSILGGLILTVVGMVLLRPVSIWMGAEGAMLEDCVLSGIFVSYGQELYEIICRAFMLYSLSFLFSGFNIFGSSFFTALNNGIISAVISFLRALVFQTGTVLLLPLLLDLDGIWYSVFAAEVVAVALTAFCLIRFKNRYHYA